LIFASTMRFRGELPQHGRGNRSFQLGATGRK
jgi:hypothetical protein